MSDEMLCIGGPYDGQRLTFVPTNYHMTSVGPGLWKRTVCVWLDAPPMMSWVDVLIDGYRPRGG